MVLALDIPAGEATSSSPRFAFSLGPPPSVVAAGPIHTRSNCLSTLAAGDHCFAALYIPSLDQSIACRRHDRLPPASAIPGCCVQSATPLSPLPHPHGPSILPPPFVRSPLCSR